MHLSFSCDSQPFLGASLEWGGAYSAQFPSLGGGGENMFSLKLLTAAALTGNYLQPQGRNSPKV